MKNIFAFILVATCQVIISCKNDVAPLVYDYEIFIIQPTESNLQLGDTLHIDVGFASQTGETIHHVNLRLFDASTEAVVYSKPDEEHVHTLGTYDFQDDVVLTGAKGFTTGEWVLEASVWGEEDGEEEVVASVHFQIVP